MALYCITFVHMYTVQTGSCKSKYCQYLCHHVVYLLGPDVLGMNQQLQDDTGHLGVQCAVAGVGPEGASGAVCAVQSGCAFCAMCSMYWREVQVQ